MKSKCFSWISESSKTVRSITLNVLLLLGILGTTERARAVGGRGPAPCDSDWSWQAISQPAGYTISGPIVVAGYGLSGNSILVAVGFDANYNQAVLGYNENLGTWTLYASGFSGGINAIVSAGGTNIYIGGTFTSFNDNHGNLVNYAKVAEFSLRSSTWSPVGSVPSLSVLSLALDAANNLYAGLASDAAPDPVTGYPGMLVEWNAVTQTWNSIGGGFDVDGYRNFCGQDGAIPLIGTPYGVTGLTVSGGSIYVAGYFDICGTGNVTAYHLAKWSPSTSSWTALATARDWCYFFSPGAEPYIGSILVNGSTLYVTGSMSPDCNGTSPVGLAEFSTTGAGLISGNGDNLWYTTDLGYIDEGVGSFVGCNSLCVQGCAVYLAGEFTGIGSASGPGEPAYGIAEKVNANAWGTWTLTSELTAAGAPATASCVASFPSHDPSHVFIVGSFDTISWTTSGIPYSIPAPGIAVWEDIPQ